MTIPPTSQSLKALAGWALSRKHDASPSQAVALDDFQQACGVLAEDIPPENAIAIRKPDGGSVGARAKTVNTQVRASRSTIVGVRPEQVENLVTCQNGGEHRFSIHTQKCVWCDQTYRAIRGRKPELM